MQSKWNKVLKWALISIGIIVGLIVIGCILLWLILSGTFIRWGDKPVLMRELKGAYNESFVIYDYEEEYSGILDISHFTYKLHPKFDSDIRFEIEFEDRELSDEQLGSYALAYMNNKITNMLDGYIYGASMIITDDVDYPVYNYSNSSDIFNSDPVEFVNGLYYDDVVYTDSNIGSRCGIYKSFISYSQDINHGKVVESLVNRLSEIGLTNFSIDIAFATPDELSALKNDVKHKQAISLYNPLNSDIIDRGDMYRLYMEGGEVLIKEVRTGSYPLEAKHFITLYLNS